MEIITIINASSGATINEYIFFKYAEPIASAVTTDYQMLFLIVQRLIIIFNWISNVILAHYLS